MEHEGAKAREVTKREAHEVNFGYGAMTAAGHCTPVGERLAGEATAEFLRSAGLADTERQAG